MFVALLSACNVSVQILFQTTIYTHTCSFLIHLALKLSLFLCLSLSPSALSGHVDPPLLNFIISPLSEFPDYKSLSDISLSVSAGERGISQASHKKGKQGASLLTRTGQFVNSQHRLLEITVGSFGFECTVKEDIKKTGDCQKKEVKHGEK